MTPDPDAELLDALRLALQALDAAEAERARAWAFSGSGLLPPADGRGARIEAEREVENARAALRRARDAMGLAVGEKAWGGH